VQTPLMRGRDIGRGVCGNGNVKICAAENAQEKPGTMVLNLPRGAGKKTAG